MGPELPRFFLRPWADLERLPNRQSLERLMLEYIQRTGSSQAPLQVDPAAELNVPQQIGSWRYERA